MLQHLAKFQEYTDLISTFGEGNAHLIWIMSLLIDHEDPITLGHEALTDANDDKKIDFLKLDRDTKTLYFAQGYYSPNKPTTNNAPSNKAADLNTAAAWLFVGDLNSIPEHLQSLVADCRQAIENEEIAEIKLYYIHNLTEHLNSENEINTTVSFLENHFSSKNIFIDVSGREIGADFAEKLFINKNSRIKVLDKILLEKKPVISHSSDLWNAYITTVSGKWLKSQYDQYNDELFTINYRGFLGLGKRRKINSGIKTTAETAPNDFFVFNNGITILTKKIEDNKLHGISIINGAQTTGSISNANAKEEALESINIMCKIIECSNDSKIDSIVKFNNTQNEITTWDVYSNTIEQNKLSDEFKAYGFEYNNKRGVFPATSELSMDKVAQPVCAFCSHYDDANRGKNGIFENYTTYSRVFKDKTAKHILLAYDISSIYDNIKQEIRENYYKNPTNETFLIMFNQSYNLKFKYYFIHLVGQCLKAIDQKYIDPNKVGYMDRTIKVKSEYSNAKQALKDFLLTLWIDVASSDLPIDQCIRTSELNTKLIGILNGNISKNILKNTSDVVNYNILKSCIY